MEGYVYILRRIAQQAGCLPVGKIALQPGIRAVYRVTMHYPDRRVCDTVSSLIRSGISQAVLETIYCGYFGNKPLVRSLDMNSYAAFARIFEPTPFDKLTDQLDIPAYGTDLCLIERAAGSFVKSVILAPPLAATPPYSVLVDTVRAFLPEALREIKCP